MIRTPLVIYHGNCADGFTAAWACHKKNPSWEFYPGHYGSPFDLSLATDRDVYFLDFSFKRPQLIELAMVSRTITILDHHKSAAEDLSGIAEESLAVGGCPINVVFDMGRSGARLAWDFFHPEDDAPPTLLRVEDRDLWRFAYPDTKDISAAVFSYEYTFDNWTNLMRLHPSVLAADGMAIRRKQDKDIRELIAGGTREAYIAGHFVPVLNVPYMFCSEAGHILAEGRPFAATYTDSKQFRRWSLRSTDAGIDVSRVAMRFGGGGHRNAAGFETSLNWLGGDP